MVYFYLGSRALDFASYTTPFSHSSREGRSRKGVEKSLSSSLAITPMHDGVEANHEGAVRGF